MKQYIAPAIGANTQSAKFFSNQILNIDRRYTHN